MSAEAIQAWRADPRRFVRDMFGVTPRITTSVGAAEPGTGTPAGDPRARRDSDRSAVPQPDGSDAPGQGGRDEAASARGERDARQADGPAAAARRAGAPRRAGGERGPASQTDSVGGQPTAATGRAAGRDEPQPDDQPAGDVLTGSSLIERELGGRIIHELDQQ